ncbi:hypothetical protein [Silanimonas sp.]|uniref:hypothetical protein n=1 Tax=Silanimonas sp. TaxID=1929290 RepID=UPI001BBE1FAB|nr:hypothetical protein [Silanimonas sp.]MBS3896460.1 hypothetical protein [Silanimonas sp.]MBS3924456.1 hypothetical protein [Xanthomonadaceae bacterium]
MIENTFLVALMVVCAYFNALFLANPTRAFRSRDSTGIAVLIGALVANAALIFLLDFDPLITLIVWLPAIAGVLAKKFFARQAS